MKRKTTLLLLFLLIISLISFILFSNGKPDESQDITPTPTQSVVVETPTPSPTPTPITYTDAPPAGYSGFFEKTPVISGQQAYIAYPLTVDPANPPQIIAYYHGSTQRVTTDFTGNQVMKDMRGYGAYVTGKNYIFIASNQHGDNWGSLQAVKDTESVIAWVRERYPAKEKILLLAFSMGGMPAMNHVVQYPTHVSKIAMLAPANIVEKLTTKDYEKFKKIPMAIWHGTADVNVPYSATQYLVKQFKAKGISPTVYELKGKTHWDVDTELKKEILTFYSET